MAPRSLYAVAAAAIIALAACSDREPGSTTGPQFAPGAATGACGFSNSLVSDYFPSSQQGKILTLKQSMANAGHGTPEARTFGFEIMDSIGSVSRNFSIDPAAGAQLTVALIGCMFTETFEYPTDALSDFTAALNRAAGGAYYVRGGGPEGLDVDGRSGTVVGTRQPLVDPAVNLSGIKPTTGTWTDMLKVVTGRAANNDLSEGRALIYGYLVSDTPRLLYDWATVPSALTFAPAAVVAVCDNDDSESAMVQQLDIGVLAYVSTSICDEIQLTSVDADWGPKALATRLSRMLAGALAPEPLQAAVLATRTGGTTTTVPKSKFGKRTVSTLTLVWEHEPPPVINGTDPNKKVPISFRVSASGSPIAGTCAYLTGSNNNGTPTKLIGPPKAPECIHPPNGDANALAVLVKPFSATASLAEFGDVGVTKTGGILFIGTVEVLNRAGSGSISFKSNVKPLK